MERQNVISTSITSIGYEDGRMQVEFKNGSVYEYKDVPLSTYQNLRASQSIGKTFDSNIRKAGYQYKKV